MAECRKCNSEIECGYEISCFQKIAGTLTKDEIKAHGLIQVTDPEHKPKFETTTVDLTVGDGHYLFDGNSNSNTDRKWKLIFIGDNENMKKLNEDLSPEKYSPPSKDKPHTLIIPAYGSALVQLNETIDTYSVANDPLKNLLIVGRFDLKLSSVHQGLISQQATQIEPCYCGKLFCFIHNLSNKEIELKWGAYLATIEFSYVSCFCNKEKKLSIIQELSEKTAKKYTSHFCNGKGIQDIRYFFDKERLPNDCGLVGFQNKLSAELFSDSSIEKLAKKINKEIDKKAKWIPVICAIITAIVTLFTAFFSFYFQHKNADLQDRVTQLEQKIKSINNEEYNET